jgi:hypothetical protein
MRKPSNIERMKAADGGMPTAKPTPLKGKPQSGPKVKHRCGHEKSVAYFLGCDCADCRKKAARERATKNAAKREQQRAVAVPSASGRLPDGAGFDVRYDAASMTWSGRLVIQRIGGADGVIFSGSAGGVERLLRDLASQYRATLVAPESPAS